ncbi:HutD family protein [Trinickia sp. LjRoot230]|uniref:HutD/Ves family protein n=1 Tax=Trinickia sp. LjRoot230 TaxID=3342288 RepID=UPI003ED09FEF
MAAVMQACGAFAATSLARGAQLDATPWRNGGGTTRELAVFPPGAGFDDFIWRLSVADIERSGPFSRFAGVDRTLVLLRGAGMQLIDRRGVSHATLPAPYTYARFPGELELQAELTDGPTRDFNLMVRRGQACSACELWYGAGAHVLDADVALIFCAQGTLDVTISGIAPMRLDAMDMLRIDAPTALPCLIAGEGTAIGVGICVERADDVS